MNAIVPQQFGPLSAAFAGHKAEDDLSAGVQASFGLIGYRGKVWSIKYRGDERQLMRDDGDGPRNSIEVVVLKSSTHISKIWYEEGYVPGANLAPDCFSNNGVAPDPSSRKLQNAVCATCPKNAWGSRITEQGKQGKACSDSKRLAIVPLQDISNDMFGGPMLLRVPPASLQDLAQFGQKMQQLGYPYYAIGIRISFDANEAYPKFLFNAIRPLTDQEAKLVITLRSNPAVDRILAEGAEHVKQDVQANQAVLQAAFEQPPNPGTSGASTQSAPTADQISPNTNQAPSTGLAPVTPLPQENKSHNGGATAATSSASNGGTNSGVGGFGPLSGGSKANAQPAAKPQTNTAPASETVNLSVPTAPPSEPQVTQEGNSTLEDELDAKLAALLGT